MIGSMLFRVTVRLLAAFLLLGMPAVRGAVADDIAVSVLASETHFHGIGVAQEEPLRLYLATHHGLYEVSAAGTAKRISETRDDLMGFSPHPTDTEVLFASGHPAEGGNLGLIGSRDGGRTWQRLGEGALEPSDFHQLTVSRADPDVFYGIYRTDVQVSEDGGRTWQVAGKIPSRIFDLATSANDSQHLYAASEGGLLASSDGGQTWQMLLAVPSTAVETTPEGALLAFTVDGTLRKSDNEGSGWNMLRDGFGNTLIMHLATGPQGGLTLAAVTYDRETKAQGLLVSRDGGESWAELGP